MPTQSAENPQKRSERLTTTLGTAPRSASQPDSIPSGALRELPLGQVEIAALLEVRRQTVEQWRHRGIFPAPAGYAGTTPLWWAADVLEWARRTGRR